MRRKAIMLAEISSVLLIVFLSSILASVGWKFGALIWNYFYVR